MFEEKISELFFADQQIRRWSRDDRVARNRVDGDGLVDPLDVRIGHVVEDVAGDQAGQVSRHVQRIVGEGKIARCVFSRRRRRGEFLEQIFQIASTMKGKRFEQLDEFGEV